MTAFANARSIALSLGIVASGCKIPAFEGSDLCSGFREGDEFEVVLRQRVQAGVSCEESLGFSEGTRLAASVSDVPSDGCGSAIGSLKAPNGSFVLNLEPDKSNDLRDGRSYSWVNWSTASTDDCSGDLNFFLTELEPTPFASAATSQILISYYDRPSGDTCPGYCTEAFAVDVIRLNSK